MHLEVTNVGGMAIDTALLRWHGKCRIFVVGHTLTDAAERSGDAASSSPSPLPPPLPFEGLDGTTIVLPLPMEAGGHRKLAPGATATWLLSVRATAAGYHTLRMGLYYGDAATATARAGVVAVAASP
mgnify:CR=1 FL=1